MQGFIISAISSNCGKTSLTIGLVRHLVRLGYKVQCAKFGPDYIDGQFLSMASGNPAYNLDLYAMDKQRINGILSQILDDKDILIVEGAMGLFDKSLNITNATADLAKMLNLPILLVANAQNSAGTIAQVVNSLSVHHQDCKIKSVVYNFVQSDRHKALITEQHPKNIAHGFLPKHNKPLDSRHLGLKLASEYENIEQIINYYADWVGENLGPKIMEQLMQDELLINKSPLKPILPPLATNIAIAKDDCFNFIYNHQILEWQKNGVHLSFFSPLRDEMPDSNAQAIFLPGGYPEIYAERLAKANFFIESMRRAANDGVIIYGECGGYMVLGQAIITKSKQKIPMLGLLNLITDFSQPKLHLSYHQCNLAQNLPIWRGANNIPAHEFHYSHASFESGNPMLQSDKAERMGLMQDTIFGSYCHFI